MFSRVLGDGCSSSSGISRPAARASLRSASGALPGPLRRLVRHLHEKRRVTHPPSFRSRRQGRSRAPQAQDSNDGCHI
eukprot:6704034-Alexandrium_andersonii.AAC.1